MKDHKNDSYFPREVTLLAGTDRPAAKTESLEVFSAQAIGFLDAFSRRLRQDSRARLDQEVMALAFWCRRAHVVSLQKKHDIDLARPHTVSQQKIADIDQARPHTVSQQKIADIDQARLHTVSLQIKSDIGQTCTKKGRGRIFHLAPANVPMMFVYTWAIGLLAGNAGIVRISERTLQREPVQDVLRIFRELFLQEEYAAVRERTSFISYARSDAVTQEVLAGCDGRVLWGGDETIRHMQQIPMSENAVELTFPDRVSLAVISEEALEKADEETLRNLVHRFYNDTYVMDQNGCSSPQTVIWLKNKTIKKEISDFHGDLRDAAVSEHRSVSVREKWWSLLAQEAEREYPMDGFRAARKLEKAAISSMQSGEISSICRYCGNALYVLRLTALPEDLAEYKGGFGLFYETEAENSSQIFPRFSSRIQTVVCIGIDPAEEAAAAERQQAAGALRFVEAGQALQMDTTWDGIDLIDALSQK